LERSSDSPRTPLPEKVASFDSSLERSGESGGPERNSAGPSRQSLGKFTTSSTKELDDDGPERDFTLRERLAQLLDNSVFQSVSGFLVILTVLLICMDTNARAQGSVSSKFEDVLMFICFAAYFLEFAASLVVQGKDAIYDCWNYIDAFVISTSLVEYMVSFFQLGDGLSILRLLRICRLLRLGKLMRQMKLLNRVSWLKEVYVLCMMMASCLRTLLWVLGLCFFCMTIWSVLAVELLNEVVVDMAENNPSLWDGCERCGRSFGSIWESNWTFFQTIVAGDSWGVMALPIIEKHAWSSVIFIGAFSSILFGLLNLISAVVIDTFAERRARDVSSLASEMEYEEVLEKKFLGKMFAQIDVDGSGALDLDELRAGASKVREFRHYLRVLDIDDNDLGELFGMIDCDGSGEVDPIEFIEALYRMKHTDPKTATRFVKHMVATMFDKQKAVDERLEAVQEGVMQRLSKVEDRLLSDLESASQKDVQKLLENHARSMDEAINKAIEKAATVALDAGMDSAISKASSAIKRVVTASSSRTADISNRVNQMYASAHSDSEMSHCTFGRQVTPTFQDSLPFSRQASVESSYNRRSSPRATPSSTPQLFHAPPQPNVAKGTVLLAQSHTGAAGVNASIIELGEAIHEQKAMTSAVPLPVDSPGGDTSTSAKGFASGVDSGSTVLLGPKGPLGTPSEKFAAKRASVSQKPPKQAPSKGGTKQQTAKGQSEAL